MKRVYLAKSNKANPNLVSAVRQTLSKFDIELVEFTGGTYSHDLLLTCDEMIAIPDLSTLKTLENEISKFTTISLGKGLWEQISTFYEAGHSPFIITDYDGHVGIGGVVYDDDDDNFYSLELNDEKNYTDYGYFCINEKNAGLVGWELYDYMLDDTNLKDNSWVSNVLNESVEQYKTWKGSDNRKKFMVVAKKRKKIIARLK